MKSALKNTSENLSWNMIQLDLKTFQHLLNKISFVILKLINHFFIRSTLPFFNLSLDHVNGCVPLEEWTQLLPSRRHPDLMCLLVKLSHRLGENARLFENPSKERTWC